MAQRYTNASVPIKSESDSWLSYGVVFVSSLVIYLLTLSHNLVASHDSIGYINEIDHYQWLFHPHHLLYNPISILWLKLFRWLGCESDSSYIVASLNSVFGAGGLVLIFIILRKRLSSNLSSTISTLITIGASFGFWFYSDCVEVYIIPLFFLLAVLCILLKPTLRSKDIILIGVFHGIAVLFHQIHVLLGFAIIARLIFFRKDLNISLSKALTLYLAPAMGIIFLSYGLVLAIDVQPKNLNDVLYWGTAYSHSLPGSWNVPSLKSLFKAFIGFSHSVFGGHFMFAVPAIKERLLQILGSHELKDEIFLVSTLSQTVAQILTILSVVFGLLLIYVLAVSLRFVKTIRHHLTPAIISIGVWILVYCLFFWVWDPTNLEFWIPQTVLLFLIVHYCLQRMSNRMIAKAIVIIFPILMLMINYFGSISRLHSEYNDYFFVEATALAKITTAKDIILTDEQWIVEGYYKRFISAAIFSPEDINDTRPEYAISKQSLSRHLDSTLVNGGSVLIAIQNPKKPLSDSQYYSYLTQFFPQSTQRLSLHRRMIGNLEIGVIMKNPKIGYLF